MNLFINLFVYLKLFVDLSNVVSYTVVLKPVKPLYSPVKVYRYDVRYPKIISENPNHAQYIYHKAVPAQRIYEHYPLVLKHLKDSAYRARFPAKKEKRKYLQKVSSSTTETPGSQDQRLQYGLPQQLVPPVSNKIEDYSEVKEEESRGNDNDIHLLPTLQQDEKSFPSFGQEKGRIYKNPGEWAVPVPTTVSPENTTKPIFTPSQLYLQIRHKNTVIHVPQTEALQDAETLEELINAPRLKELARTTHVQEVYSEEGYEDGAYDHAGHIRGAQHGEVYDTKDEGVFRIKETAPIIDYDSDLEESKRTPLRKVNSSFEESFNEKPESRTSQSRTETGQTFTEYGKIPQSYKGEHKYSSRVKTPSKPKEHNQQVSQELIPPPTNQNENGFAPTFPSYFGEMPPVPLENTHVNNSTIPFKPPEKKSSKYRKEELNSTKIFPISDSGSEQLQPTHNFTDFRPYLLAIDTQASPSTKSLKYSRIYSKKTKQLRLEPYKTGDIYQPPPPPPLPPTDIEPLPTDKTQEEESINQRIVLPTIGYINSLTTAHFGKGSSMQAQEEPKTELTSALNLTQALDYLRSNKNQKDVVPEVTEPPTEIEVRTFEPMKLKKFRSKFVPKAKRDVYLIRERDKRSKEDYEGNDESDLPHDEKNEEIAQDERERIEEENREKEKYEMDLKKAISNKEEEILKETFKNIGVQRDIEELFPELPHSSGQSDDEEDSDSTPEAQEPIDSSRYPFYFSKKLPENSALRYASNPRHFPVKSGFRMEFYESRDESIQCPEFHPDLDDLPNSNSTEYSDTQPGENLRLVGLGDKIVCLRNKYFGDGRNPLDNPIFKEKEIDYVGKPKKGFRGKGAKASQSKITLKKQKPNLEVTDNQKTQTKHKKKSEIQKPNHYPPQADSKPKKYIQTSSKKVTPDKPNTTPSKQFMFSPTTTRNSITNKTQKVQSSSQTSVEPQDNNYATTPIGFPEIDFSSLNKQTNNWPKQKDQQQSNPSTTVSRIIIPHNCLPIITSLASTTGNKNLIIDCNDAVLIKEIINGIGYQRIIPKMIEKVTKPPKEVKYDESDWIPIPGYAIPAKSQQAVSRKTDEVVIAKNETNQNTSSDHYVIDELKEDENVRKGEVVEDMTHYLKLMETEMDEVSKTLEEKANQTRRKREAQNDKGKPKKKISILKKPSIEIFEKNIDKNPDNRGPGSSTQSPDSTTNGGEVSKPFVVSKRKLTRLSGSDFLTRYHKNKAHNFTPEKTADFWKISTSSGVKTTKEPSIKKKEIENTTKKTVSEKPADKLITRQSSSDQFRTSTPPPPPPPPPPQTVTEKSVSRTETKSSYKFENLPTKTTTERSDKPETEENDNYPKLTPLNLIPEKLARKPNVIEASEFRKTTTTSSSVTERKTIKPETSTKFTGTIERVKSENAENPVRIYKKTDDSTSKLINTSEKVENSQEKRTKLESNQSKTSETDESNKATGTTTIGPILYYVVNGRTGRGKWITDYEQRRALFRNPGILRKSRKFNSKYKNERRGKKLKN